ncbi:MAG: S-layer homology domain-containing protein [Roseburia sp.]|nr:S-layer homology domain-containing protein [Lachnospiraceae bacterium]MCM1568864.1 S-layer homology domain-containing protein [Roseburia sp.]
MKKRLLSMLLALAMLLTLAPSAWAASADESKFDGLYRPDPKGSAVYLGKGPDGVMEFERTIPVGGNGRNPLTDDSAVHFSNNSSDESVVYFPNPKQYIGKAPGTAVLSFYGYINDTSANKLWARLTVTVLSKEDYRTYQDAASVSVDGHSHVWRKQSTLPTCGQTGQLVNRCAVCGQEEFLKTLEKLPHSYSYSYDKSNNQNVYSCPYCGDRYTVPVNSQNPTATTNPINPGTSTPTNPQPSTPVESQKPHTHDYSSEVTKAATASQTGIRTYKCKVCGDTYTETIPATGNSIANNLPKTIHPTMANTVTKLTGATPAKSYEFHSMDSNGGEIRPYLYVNENGQLTRVEYIAGKNSAVIVEEYDSSFKLQSSLSIKPELSLWGGFYAGKDYNYLIFGQLNYEEDDSKEVIRVVKYSKDWERLGAVGILGANTRSPFNAGTLRCAEYGGYLYVRTCHKIYRGSDGIVHQTSMMFAVRESDMTLTECQYEVQGNGTGYVSHSFDEHILIGQDGTIVTVDLGDAFPRGVAFAKYHSNAATGRFGKDDGWDWCDFQVLQKFPGEIGDNSTGCYIGGVVETSKGYIVPFDFDQKGGRGSTRYMYLAYVDKQSGQAQVRQLETSGGVSVPKIVSTGMDSGYILWLVGSTYETAGTLHYCTYRADGSTGPIQTANNAAFSRCQPIVYNGDVVWYVTDNRSEPVFYILNATGITSVNTGPEKVEVPGNGKPVFSDVPDEAFFAEPVAWAVERGITNGTSTTTFSPYQQCTQVQILTFLWRAAGEPASSNALPISITGKNIDYAETALRWASENNMIDSGFVPNKPCTRASAVKFIWQAFGSPTTMTWTASGGYQTSSSSFSDVSANSEYADAVSWAVDEGVTTGTSNTTFSPNDICNRGQIVTFLYRAYH